MSEHDEAEERPDVRVADGDIVVNGYDAQADALSVPLDVLCTLAGRVARAEGVAAGRIDLHLVDRATITELNVEHMGAEGATDVLSFPLDDDPTSGLSDGPDHLGDIVLAPDVAAAQASEHTGSESAELTLLVTHGVLHLLGHDHAEDDERLAMQARERLHLADAGFDHPVPTA